MVVSQLATYVVRSGGDAKSYTNTLKHAHKDIQIEHACPLKSKYAMRTL